MAERFTFEDDPQAQPRYTFEDESSFLDRVGSALVEIPKRIYQAAITQPEGGFFDIHSPLESGRRFLDVGKGLLGGITAGIYQPEVTDTEAARARATAGNVAGIAVPYGAAVKGLEAVGMGSRLLRGALAGGAVGAAAPLSQGQLEEAAVQGTAGAALGATGETLLGRRPAKTVVEKTAPIEAPRFTFEPEIQEGRTTPSPILDQFGKPYNVIDHLDRVVSDARDSPTVAYQQGPISPYDGKTVFDPNVPVNVPKELTHFNRAKGLVEEIKGSPDYLASKLPQEEFVRRANPNSPVISAVERVDATIMDRMGALIKDPAFQARLRYSDIDWVNFERDANNRWKASGDIKQALEAFPQDVRPLIVNRMQSVAKDQINRTELGLPEFDQVSGPYVPRRVAEDVTAVQIRPRGQTLGQDLQTTVGSFQRSRQYATMAEGMSKGINYEPVADSWLNREYLSVKLDATASMMRELKGRVLFESREAALDYANRTGIKNPTPTEVKGLPGPAEQQWFTPTKAEARFLQQNLTDPRFRMPGTQFLNATLRNPNLFNPAPHFFKNMLYKYGMSGGSFKQVIPDMMEFFQGSNPRMLDRYQQVMPFSREGRLAYELTQQELRRSGSIGGIKKITQQVGQVASNINRPSSKAIFTKLDPGLKYARWKQYVEKGMSDQEAANNVQVDLIRYGARSDLLDFWKSIPANFFATWRTQSPTSVIKNLAVNPYRVVAFTGAAEAVREIISRNTGTYFHMPVDYVQGPIMRTYHDFKEKPLLAASLLTGARLLSIFAFGPGGEMAVRTIEGGLKMLNGEDTKILNNIFWGASQLYGFGKDAYAFMQDQNPQHLLDALSKAFLGAYGDLQKPANPRPHVGEFIPKEWTGQAEEVRRAEAQRKLQELRKAQRVGIERPSLRPSLQR